MELIDTPNPNAKKIIFDQKTEETPSMLFSDFDISSLF